MRIGVPKETKTLEGRVALVPAAAGDLVKRGHEGDAPFEGLGFLGDADTHVQGLRFVGDNQHTIIPADPFPT